jgi:hypothetical protein
MSEDKIQFRRSGEWTMVYLNGKLVKYGDSYHADEWLQSRCGVEVVDDEAGICIPDGHNPILSLAEVEAIERSRTEMARQAVALREKATELLTRAQKLEKGEIEA